MHAVSDYLDQTDAWSSSAGVGPTLRGRRSSGHGTAIHFLHGNGFCGGTYWPFLREVRQQRPLFCHDIEGHGASDAPTQFSGKSRIIARIPQIMAEQGLGGTPSIGIGHSFGAALTTRVAAANPGMFKALVLLDPIFLPPLTWLGLRLAASLGRNPISQAARRRRSRWASREEAVTKLRDRGIYQGWTEEALQCFIEYATRDDADGTRVLSCPTTLEAAIFDHPIYPWAALPQLDCPVLLLHGEQSYGFMAGAARKAARSNPRIERQAYRGGHCFMQEDPNGSAAVVREFLGRHALQ
jgi:pimeloyl-ACP methyl ester carboxylesterase